MKASPLKVYRKDNRRRRVTDWRACLRIGGAAVLICVVALGIYVERRRIRTTLAGASAFIFDNRYFALREIEVHSGEKVGGSEIVAVAGLSHGMNLWKVDAAAIEKRIRRHPWVRRVLVRREFPRRIVIDVEERQPRAIVALGKLYYVDADGLLFSEVGDSAKAKFPLLTGLRGEDLTAAGPVVQRRVQEAMRLGELIQHDGRTLSEIHFDAPDQVVLYITGQRMALRMGWGDWLDKIRRMERILELWKGHEERLASLDLSFRDQVVARLRQVKQS
jgi:cell division protein FtsQ